MGEKKKSGEGQDAPGFAVTRPDLLWFLKLPYGSITLRFLGLSLRPASSGFFTLFGRLLGGSSRFGFCCTGVRLPFRLGSGDLSAFAAQALLRLLTVCIVITIDLYGFLGPATADKIAEQACLWQFAESRFQCYFGY